MSYRTFDAPLTVLPEIDFGDDLRSWIVAQATHYNLQYLLTHADDGVNWGIVDNGQLTISHDCYPDYAPELRLATLQQVRLFGDGGELYLWRVDGQWHGRFLDGSRDKDADTLPTCYLLWGTSEDTRQKSADARFILLADGEEGLRHAPPRLKDFAANSHYLALKVLHYVAYDGDGQAHVAASRLVGLEPVERKEKAEDNK